MMYKLSHVDDSSLSICKGIMQEIYKEEPSHWPCGLSVVGHDDMYLIHEKVANKPIGFVGFQKISESNGDLIGWYTVGIKPEYRKQGYAKEAVETMLTRHHPEVKEVKAMIMSSNSPSIELAAALDIPARIKNATSSLLQFALDQSTKALETEKEQATNMLDDEERRLKLQEQEIKIREHKDKGLERMDKLREKEEKRQEKNQKSVADATKALAQQEQDRVDMEQEKEEADQLAQEQEDEKILMEQEDFNSRLPMSLRPKGSGGGGVQIKGNKGIYANMPGNNMKMEQEKPVGSGTGVAPKAASLPSAGSTAILLRMKKTAVSKAQMLLGAGVGVGASSAENVYLLPGMSPEMHKINQLIGGISGAMIGRGGRPAIAAAGAWPLKQMALVGTGEAQNYIAGQSELADKKLRAAESELSAAESSASTAANISGSVKALLAGAAVGTLGYGGYKLYEYIQKQQKKKKRGLKGDATIRGKVNRKRHKVRMTIPAESLPPEFWKSLINIDDAPHVSMKAPRALLENKRAATKWYKDTTLTVKLAQKIEPPGIVGNILSQAPSVLDQLVVRPAVIPTLRGIQDSPLFKMVMPDQKLIGNTYVENRAGGYNPFKLYDHRGQGQKRMLLEMLNKERSRSGTAVPSGSIPRFESNPTPMIT